MMVLAGEMCEMDGTHQLNVWVSDLRKLADDTVCGGSCTQRLTYLNIRGV